ncbi:Homeobox-leucine zipper family protein / lipid-binding START domain-containing protein isoform 6 [Tripterygium wilfordii]|uniref:Homeobox-leucine zipper family protein / lipid-binding START domain-containing protein isoform 6 n=1 Tax=Tripterygium wilfordii TaxID=458696 RepID=A0A7J7E212_TRIWF|nr:Homeobox-leucine zipper family protein / lipid-binding START domain-containing protein isoform 6 [Tripterygium wilfordii]
MSMAHVMHNKEALKNQQMDSGKYVRYTTEQVEALERVYLECPKPSSLRRQQLIRECPILSNIEPKQIKVWFQNRRFPFSSCTNFYGNFICLGRSLPFVYYGNASATTTDNSCESVVMSGQNQQQQNPTPLHPKKDANNPAGLLSIAEETLAEFLSKATGTAVDWVQMIGMKPGPDSMGIVAVSRNCSGVAARACGLVSLEPTKVAEILKDRPSWFRDCRCVDVLSSIPTGNGGTIELMYMQTYAPTTLAAARDFWTLRYTTSLEDGSFVICERSLTNATGGPPGPPTSGFIRAEMLPSGYLVRPCEGGGSIIHIVDHVDLDVCSVPEVLRPLYESSKMIAQKMTMAALRHIRQIALETSGEIQYGGGRQPAVLRTFSQRLCRVIGNGAGGERVDQRGFARNVSLGRLQDSNAVLSHFNEYSEHCFAEVSGDFVRNTRVLKSMKSDLDYIFQKLRGMKAKILATYPDAFPDESTIEVLDRRPDLEMPQ